MRLRGGGHGGGSSFHLHPRMPSIKPQFWFMAKYLQTLMSPASSMLAADTPYYWLTL